MSFSERYNEGRGNLNNNRDQNNLQNNPSGSHNQPTISQQQNFGGGGGSDLTVVQEQQRMAPPFLQWTSHVKWTQELRIRFADAVNKLGGPDSAKPKALLEEMAIEGLTVAHVKSYLQRVRNGRRSNRPGMGDQNVGGNLETGTVTTPLYSAQQQYQVDVADISAVHEGRFMTSNGYPFPGPYNNPTSSTAINIVQADLQIHTPGFLDNNGTFYRFQPGNGNHLVQLAQYCRALGNIQQGNELARVVQQSPQDVGALGNIQQQNQPQAATDNVQAQNATPDNMETMEEWMDYFDWYRYCNQELEDF